MDALSTRRKHLAKTRRVVVKVGSNVLSNKDGLNTRRIGTLGFPDFQLSGRGPGNSPGFFRRGGFGF